MNRPTDAEIVAAIRATRGRHGVPRWATTWEMVEELAAFPPRSVLEALASCIDRGVIDGHACDLDEPYCRGDFEIPADVLCLRPFEGGPCVRLLGHDGLCTKNVRLAPELDRDDGRLVPGGGRHPAETFPNDGTFAIFPP